jgi:hypothetical protein
MTTVSRTIRYTVLEASRPGAESRDIEFRYTDTDPLAVSLDFGYRRGEKDPVVWRVARDVLADGMTSLAGLLDVSCWVAGGYYHIALNSPDGHAVFQLYADEVMEFLADAETLVPYGAERIDMDTELALLLGGAR